MNRITKKIINQGDNSLYNIYQLIHIKKSLKKISFKENLLDVGSGSAPYKELFLQKVKKYYTQDISGTKESKDRFDYEGDFNKIKIEKKFDIILCFEVIEHIEEYKKTLNKIYHLLNKKGIFLLSFPDNYPSHGYPHMYHKFSHILIENILKKQYKIIYYGPKGTSLHSTLIFGLNFMSNFDRVIRPFVKNMNPFTFFTKIIFIPLFVIDYILTKILPKKTTKHQTPGHFYALVKK